MGKKPIVCLIILLLLLPAAVWRFLDLERDPPLISGELGSWIDPGYFLYNARSHSLFGEWRGDEGHSLFVAPGYASLATLWFLLLGTGYSQAALLSILSGSVVILATAICAEWVSSGCRTDLPRYWCGCAALASLLLSYVFFALQRVPKADMESIALSSLSALAFIGLDRPHSSDRRIRVLAVLSGLGTGLVPFVKLSSGLFSAAALAAWTLSYPLLDAQWKYKWRRATPYVFYGLLISSCVWVGWALWLYHLNLFDLMLRRSFFIFGTAIPSIAESPPSQELVNYRVFLLGRFLQSNIFYRHPAETILATVSVFRLLFLRRWNWPLFFSCVWLIVGVVTMTFVIATVRYRMLFVPPATILAANLWTELAARKMPRLERRKNILISAASGIILAYIVIYSLSIRMLGLTNRLSEYFAFTAAVLLITPAAAFFVWLALERLPHRFLAWALVLLMIFVSLPQWWIGERASSHEMRDAARWISANCPGAVLAGWWGAQLALWTSADCYLQWTPSAVRRVTLIVGEPADLQNAPLKSREVGRKIISPRKLAIVFAAVER